MTGALLIANEEVPFTSERVRSKVQFVRLADRSTVTFASEGPVRAKKILPFVRVAVRFRSGKEAVLSLNRRAVKEFPATKTFSKASIAM